MPLDCGFLKKTLPKFFGRHFEVFQKFNDTSSTLINFLFDQIITQTTNFVDLLAQIILACLN